MRRNETKTELTEQPEQLDLAGTEPAASAVPAKGDKGDQKIDRMGTESTFKLLLEFSIPAVVGVLVQMLYNVIDAVYVGHAVGADGLAATTVANPMMTAMVAVAMLVGVGGNALAAIKLGERKKEVAERVVGNSFVLLLIATVLLWAVAVFALEPILRDRHANTEIIGEAPDVLGDPDRLKQAVTNLVENASRFIEPDGHITIELFGLKGNSILAVKDDGTGFGDIDPQLLFDRFYRTDASRSRGTGGTGLGLAIVKSVVEAHDGTVEAINLPDGGACFIIALPSIPADISRKPERKPER